jgi:hypothetical protein
MRVAIAVRLTGIFLTISCFASGGSDSCAQGRPAPSSPRLPWACVFLDSGQEADIDLADDPPEERAYAASLKDLYRLWCTANPSTLDEKQSASDRTAIKWKSIWYRDNPYSASFHETGSFELLVLIGVTHRIPKAMVNDPVFLHDWMEDCSDRCFMLYGDDDPGARKEWLRFMRLRKEVIVHLGADPAARSVVAMLKNAKLYPVN